MAVLTPPIFVPEPDETRPANPFIWVSLFIAFFLLIFLALFGYLNVSKKPGATYEQIQSRMREGILDNAFQEFIGAPVRPTPKSDGEIKQLEPLHNKDVLADKLYLASKEASGAPVSAKDAKLLLDSKDPADNAFATIYTSKTLTPQQAQQLGSTLPEEPFVNQVARIEALKKAGVKQPYLQVIGRQRAGTFAFAFTFCLFAIAGGACLWIAYIAARTTGKLQPLGHPSEPMTEPWAERYAVRVLQLLLGYVAIGVGVAYIFRSSKDHFVPEMIETLATVAMVPLIYFLPVSGKRISAKRQGWRSENLGKNVAWGLAAAMANAPLLVVLGIIGKLAFSWLPQESHPIAIELENHRSLLTFLLATVSASVCAPIFEETLFRGTLLPALTTKFGSMVWGIVISSFFFAAMHPTGPPAWLPLAGIGAVSALLTYQTKSLVPSVVMHAAHNLAMVLLALAFT